MSHSALFSLTHFFCMRRAACPDCAGVCAFFFYIYICVCASNEKQTSVTCDITEHKQYPTATFESRLSAHFLSTNGSVGVELLPALRVR